METGRETPGRVIALNCLMIIETVAFALLLEYLAAQEVEVVVASPAASASNVSRMDE